MGVQLGVAHEISPIVPVDLPWDVLRDVRCVGGAHERWLYQRPPGNGSQKTTVQRPPASTRSK